VDEARRRLEDELTKRRKLIRKQGAVWNEPIPDEYDRMLRVEVNKVFAEFKREAERLGERELSEKRRKGEEDQRAREEYKRKAVEVCCACWLYPGCVS
jgi:hypothetical protein